MIHNTGMMPMGMGRAMGGQPYVHARLGSLVHPGMTAYQVGSRRRMLLQSPRLPWPARPHLCPRPIHTHLHPRSSKTRREPSVPEPPRVGARS